MTTQSYNEKPALEYLFHPGSIAIVGVSTGMAKVGGGREFLESLLDVGFKGKLYPVSLDRGKIFGLKLYPTIKDIPDTVDYVISAIPAQYTPQLIADCADRGVRTVHMFTAGFSELGDKEGEQLELEITTIARQKSIRIIGPNCLGLYCPKTGLAFCTDSPKKNGSIGFISQSGGNSVYAIREGAIRGVFFSKIISYGNACDLNETDFLEYLTHDPETKIIAVYIEGVKDGARFIEGLKQATKAKPVIIYKGGTTESGTRAVASHTGSIAGSDRTWNALLKQVGAIQVDSMEELVDMLVLFKYMSPPKGRSTTVIGIGGGANVQAADACSDAGLSLPMFPAEIRQQLKDLYATETGGSFRNPIDMYWGKEDMIQETIKIIADYKQIDLLVIHIMVGFNPKNEARLINPYIESIISRGKEINRRTTVVLQSVGGSASSKKIASEAQTALYKAGFAVYPSISRAANAINKFIEYHHRQ